MKKDLAKIWAKRIEACEASGLSIRAFCKQNRISASNLYAWKAKLNTPKTAPVAKQVHRLEEQKAKTFVQIPLAGQANQKTLQCGLTLKVNESFSIELTKGFDEALLLKTLKVLLGYDRLTGG